MVDRVLLNPSGLKVSKPGVSVTSAGLLDLQFSSDWIGMGLVQQGTFPINAWNVSGTTGTLFGSVPFIKTYITPPFCLFQLYVFGNWQIVGSGAGFVFTVNRGDGSPGSRSAVVAQVQTNQLLISAQYSKQTSGVTTPNYSLRYFIFSNSQ